MDDATVAPDLLLALESTVRDAHQLAAKNGESKTRSLLTDAMKLLGQLTTRTSDSEIDRQLRQLLG